MREKLTKTRDERPDRPKGGKRKKKQAKRPKAQRKSGKVSGSSSGGGGSSVTLCQVNTKEVFQNLTVEPFSADEYL